MPEILDYKTSIYFPECERETEHFSGKISNGYLEFIVDEFKITSTFNPLLENIFYSNFGTTKQKISQKANLFVINPIKANIEKQILEAKNYMKVLKEVCLRGQHEGKIYFEHVNDSIRICDYFKNSPLRTILKLKDIPNRFLKEWLIPIKILSTYITQKNENEIPMIGGKTLEESMGRLLTAHEINKRLEHLF